MAHDLKKNDLVTNEAVVILRELTPFTSMLRRPVESQFSAAGIKPGESIRIKKPARFIGRDGDAMSTENIVQPQVTLTLEPLTGVDVEITDREWALDLDSFSRDIVRPAMVTIASKIEARAMQYMTQATANAVGTPGTTPNSTLTYLQAGREMTNLGAPKSSRSIYVPTDAMATIVNAVQALQHPGPEISRQYREGYVTTAHGFDWYETTSEYTHTTGTVASSTPLVNGASQSGTSLITDGWNSGASDLTKGDVFWIDNVFSVHPQNRNSTGINQRFTVTQAISDTAGAMTISIDPEIKGPGDPHQNVNALPADDAALVLQGSTVASPVQNGATASPQALACHPDAYVAAFVPLPRHDDVSVSQVSRDRETGIAIRLEQQTELRSGSNLARFDVLWGIVAAYPELACRVYA